MLSSQKFAYIIHFTLVMRFDLGGVLGSVWGRLGDPCVATWASSGHLGGATGQVKRTNDKM